MSDTLREQCHKIVRLGEVTSLMDKECFQDLLHSLFRMETDRVPRNLFGREIVFYVQEGCVVEEDGVETTAG
jgi:hypothetical protein